jgi:NAD(P)-dependent dehydrogenase (short-subunit alcohol dehydrogenase family)
MTQDTTKVVLITGASSGIGQASAQYLHQKGYRVYGTSRKVQRHPSRNPTKVSRAESAAAFPMFQMDVDSDQSVRNGVDYILTKEGRIDVVVNNAGFGIAGAVEDTSLEEAQALFETNIWGAFRVCKAVLPLMRAQRSGYIITISSIGGHIAIPFQGLYSASKFALEGMTEALRMEVRRFGIHVVLIEPGDCCTQFTVNRCRTIESHHNQAYAEQCNAAVEVMEHDEMHGFAPDKIARVLERIIRKPSPRLRYAVAPPPQKLAVVLKKVLPSRLFEFLIMKYYRL